MKTNLYTESYFPPNILDKLKSAQIYNMSEFCARDTSELIFITKMSEKIIEESREYL
jgi:hypothetical protein